MTRRDSVVVAAGGLEVVPRRAAAHGDRGDLTVSGVRSVAVPGTPPLASHGPEGQLWRRQWSLPDRLVLEFIDGPVVEVRDCDGAVTFDRELPQDLEEHLLLDHVLPLVLARRGALVLHGAVIGTGRQGVVLTGHTGAGKSTMTAFLGERAWTIGGDDAAVVELGPPVTVEPTYSTIRLTPDATGLLGMPSNVGVAVAGKRRLDLDGHGGRPRPVPLALVARLNPVSADREAAWTRRRGFEALDLLLSNAFHSEIGRGERFGHVLDGLTRLAEAVLVGDLLVPRGLDGLAAAERALQDLLAT